MRILKKKTKNLSFYPLDFFLNIFKSKFYLKILLSGSQPFKVLSYFKALLTFHFNKELKNFFTSSIQKRSSRRYSKNCNIIELKYFVGILLWIFVVILRGIKKIEHKNPWTSHNVWLHSKLHFKDEQNEIEALCCCFFMERWLNFVKFILRYLELNSVNF